MSRLSPVCVVLGIFLLSAPVASQVPPKQPAKGKKIDSLPGFKKMTIDGFQVMVHDGVMKEQEDGKYKRKPLETLEIELKQVSKVMTKAQADIIRNNVQVWVEWNTREVVNNGRAGVAAGLYMGTHPRPFLSEGKEIYVSGVRILQMQSITARHQNDDAGDSVLLHEFAHAFHDLVLGYDHQGVKDVFRQALERKLYDKSLYLTTNEKEFFAELTCAYLDKLDNYPHNREELKKHDPVSFKLFESLWGRRKDVKVAPKESPFSLDGTLADVTLGKPLNQPTLKKDDLTGRVVAVVYWAPGPDDTPASLQKLASWHDELGDFGLLTFSDVGFGVERTGVVVDEVEVQKFIRNLAPAAPHFLNGTAFKTGGHKLPHAAVFDASGQCVFRGTPFEADVEVRAALGRAVVAASGVEKFTASVAPFADGLKKGQLSAVFMQKLLFQYRVESGVDADQLRALIGQLTAPAQKRLDEIAAQMTSDPWKSFERLERFAFKFRNTQVGAKAAAHVAQLKSNKVVATELRARPSLEAIRKLETTLNGIPGSFDPTQARFQSANVALLNQLRSAIEKIKKAYPDSKSEEEAQAIGKRFAITVK